MIRDSSTATVELYSQDVQNLLKSCRDVIRGLMATYRETVERVGSIDLIKDHSMGGKAEAVEDEASTKGGGVGIGEQTRTAVDVDREEEEQDMYDFDADHGY